MRSQSIGSKYAKRVRSGIGNAPWALRPVLSSLDSRRQETQLDCTTCDQVLDVLVLIDESGDPGFKLTRGSTSHFVIAMVIFQANADAERTGLAIKRLGDRLRVRPEFKFSKCCDVLRDEFFDCIAPMPFSVRGIVVDKCAITSNKLRDEKAMFYNFFVKMLLNNDNGALKGARIKIDGSGDRAFRQELNAYLRRELSQHQIQSVKFDDSRSNNLIQLADMCAGAILRGSRASPVGNVRWLQKLQKAGRIGNVWNFK